MDIANKFAQLLLNKNKSIHVYEKVLDFAPIPMFLSDSHGMCLYANKSYCDMLKTTLDRVLGDGWMTFIHQNDFKLVKDRWEMCLKEDVPYSLKHKYSTEPGSSVEARVRVEKIDGYLFGFAIPSRWRMRD